MAQIATLSKTGVAGGNEIYLKVQRIKKTYDKKITFIHEPRSKTHWNRGSKVSALDMLKTTIAWELTAIVKDLTSDGTVSDESFKTGRLNEWAPLPATGLSNVTIKYGDTTLTEDTDYSIDYANGRLKILDSAYAEKDCTISYNYDKSAINQANILGRFLEKGGDITFKFNKGSGSALESTHTVQMNKFSMTYEATRPKTIGVMISLVEASHR